MTCKQPFGNLCSPCAPGLFPSVETVFPPRVGVFPAVLTRPAEPGSDAPQDGSSLWSRLQVGQQAMVCNRHLAP